MPPTMRQHPAAVDKWSLSTMLDSTTKRCSKCKTVKPVTEFHKSTRNGFNSWCKECRSTAKPKPPITNTKACRICLNVFPRTREYFWVNKQNTDGFYTTCINCSKTIASDYYHSHKEICNHRSTDWAKRNPDKVKMIKQRARKKNPVREGQKIRGKRWRDRHPERTRYYTAERRARVKNAEGQHTADDILLQIKSQKRKCWWCGCKLTDSYEVDHLTPLNRGGTNWPNNIVISCKHCNTSRQDRLPHEWSNRLI